MKLHKAKAEPVLRNLLEAYQKRRGLFAHVHASTHAPQRIHIPEGMEPGGLDHRRWLFFACLTDRRTVSEGVYKAHVELYRRDEWMYEELGQPQDVARIRFAIGSARVGLPNQSALYWPRCSRTLFKTFGGDPANMFMARTINQLMAWKRDEEKVRGEDPLPGYGPKIMSLLAIFLEEVDAIAPVTDALPIDVHVQRFFLANDLITITAPVNNVRMEDTIRPYLTELCEKWKASRVDMAHALWLLGNRICTQCHRNTDAELLCPAYASCKGAPETRTYFVEGIWRPGFVRLRKGGDRVMKIVGPLFDSKP